MTESETGAGHGTDDGAPTDYETATARLDEIITRLDSGDAQLRETLDLCAEAKALIEYCAAELAAVDEGLNELRLDDLAASLRSADTARPSAAQPDPAQRTDTSGPVESADLAGSAEASYGEEPPPPEEPPF
jgi:exodeoxyribonuclease VII small subunit